MPGTSEIGEEALVVKRLLALGIWETKYMQCLSQSRDFSLQVTEVWQDLNMGISPLSEVPSIYCFVHFEGHSCLWRGFVPEYLYSVGLVFHVLWHQRKRKQTNKQRDKDLCSCHRRGFLSLIYSGQGWVELISRSRDGFESFESDLSRSKCCSPALRELLAGVVLVVLLPVCKRTSFLQAM